MFFKKARKGIFKEIGATETMNSKTRIKHYRIPVILTEEEAKVILGKDFKNLDIRQGNNKIVQLCLYGLEN